MFLKLNAQEVEFGRHQLEAPNAKTIHSTLHINYNMNRTCIAFSFAEEFKCTLKIIFEENFGVQTLSGS